MNEFSFISHYLTPLTLGRKEALGLKDDAAVFSPHADYNIVITKDAIAEGTHFFKGDNPYNLARKLVRVNISDLAAMGATPIACFLALILPKDIDENWLKEFCNGLKADMDEFGCFIAGGDTIVHNGDLVLTLTAMGEVQHNKALLRSGAQNGDAIFITGNIGDSYLGLQILKGEYGLLPADMKEYTISRYHLPCPRINVGKELHGIATSCMDVSDGLVADLGHICTASQKGAEIYLEKIPLSQAGLKACKLDKTFSQQAITGGDDYELLFTAPSSFRDKIKDIADKCGVNITEIGKISGNEEVRILDEGKEIKVAGGYRHF